MSKSWELYRRRPPSTGLLAVVGHTVYVRVGLSTYKVCCGPQLLNESEATVMRLTEQAKILKEEIRRMERNQAREKEISNMEYLTRTSCTRSDRAERERERVLTCCSEVHPQHLSRVVRFKCVWYTAKHQGFVSQPDSQF